MASKENICMNGDKNKGMYWFAHGNSQEISSTNDKSDLKNAETQLQKEKDERIRIFRELQEEERRRKLWELEHHFQQTRKHREQQEKERRRKIEEARSKELERRHQVEERKRQIWEAEQERKEAILRRNMEREARIEARRNAQRNSQSFAFGSSTPRTFDLDLAAINSSHNSVLMASVSGRRFENKDTLPPRATSACSLDSKLGEDCMSRSMVSLSSSTFCGRRRTDITSIQSHKRSVTPHAVTARGNNMRAVSMTRLDQLAQPRLIYRNPSTTVSTCTSQTTTANGPRMLSSSMSRSMYNLNGKTSPVKSTTVKNRKMQLNGSLMQNHSTNVPSTPPLRNGMRAAQSMMHLSLAPRLTRTYRLRQEALANSRASSTWNINNNNYQNALYLSTGKDHSRSPSRPQSSMSGISDISATTSSSTSAVNMRPRPPPRRPRPISVHGSLCSSGNDEKVPEKKSKSYEKNTPMPFPKQRAKSATRERDEKISRMPSADKKPLPPPKPSDIVAKAKSIHVNVKDNLRKTPKVQANENVLQSKKAAAEVKPSNKIDVTYKADNISSKPISKESNDFSAFNSEFPISQNFIDEKFAMEQLNSEKKLTPVVTKSLVNLQEAVIVKNIPINSDVGNNLMKESTPKSKISSEEEARTSLAEKRRSAREQAEKEAEIERQKLEELRLQEEEKKRMEEEEQRKMEEEQIKLAEMHRRIEQEKLQRAIEEQQLKEKEELEKRNEEIRQKAIKEEQEQKAREDAEKQRIELEEKLQKEEEERAERKKRVEQIMARTRGKSTKPPSTHSDIISNMSKSVGATSSNPDPFESETTVECTLLNDSKCTNKIKQSASFHVALNADLENIPSTSVIWTSEENTMPVVLSDSSGINKCLPESKEELSKVNMLSSCPVLASRIHSANSDKLLNANGYSSHEEMSCTTSPEENAGDLVVDIQQEPSLDSKDNTTDFMQLIELDLPSSNSNINNDNFLVDVGNGNSNLNHSHNSFVDLPECLQKKHDSSLTDLLS